MTDFVICVLILILLASAALTILVYGTYWIIKKLIDK